MRSHTASTRISSRNSKTSGRLVTSNLHKVSSDGSSHPLAQSAILTLSESTQLRVCPQAPLHLSKRCIQLRGGLGRSVVKRCWRITAYRTNAESHPLAQSVIRTLSKSAHLRICLVEKREKKEKEKTKRPLVISANNGGVYGDLPNANHALPRNARRSSNTATSHTFTPA